MVSVLWVQVFKAARTFVVFVHFCQIHHLCLQSIQSSPVMPFLDLPSSVLFCLFLSCLVLSCPILLLFYYLHSLLRLLSVLFYLSNETMIKEQQLKKIIMLIFRSNLCNLKVQNIEYTNIRPTPFLPNTPTSPYILIRLCTIQDKCHSLFRCSQCPPSCTCHSFYIPKAHQSPLDKRRLHSQHKTYQFYEHFV